MRRNGVYKILNHKTGEFYIGSAGGVRGFQSRYLDHWGKLRKGLHANPHLQNSWNTWGEGSFSFIVLLICSKSHCLLFEQRAIDYLKPIFNVHKIANSPIGVKRSKEGIKNNSKAKLKMYSEDPEARKRTSEAVKKFCSSPEGQEIRSKASEKVWSNPETHKKASDSRKKHYQNPEARRVASEAAKRRWDRWREEKLLRSQESNETSFENPPQEHRVENS